MARSQLVTFHGSAVDSARTRRKRSTYVRQANPPWRRCISMTLTMYVNIAGASDSWCCKYMLEYVAKRRSHSNTLPGGRTFIGVNEIVGCCPLVPTATETIGSEGDASEFSSTYAPSQILDLTLGSAVAPSQDKEGGDGVILTQSRRLRCRHLAQNIRHQVLWSWRRCLWLHVSCR